MTRDELKLTLAELCEMAAFALGEYEQAPRGCASRDDFFQQHTTLTKAAAAIRNHLDMLEEFEQFADQAVEIDELQDRIAFLEDELEGARGL